jgi:hypothetical protein
VESTFDTKRKVVALRSTRAGLVGHHRPEVGTADADVDHVADRLAGEALPIAAPDGVSERRHAVEHAVDLRHHVDAVDDERRVAWHAQRDVEHRPPLRHVDLLAREHRVDVGAQARLLGELHEECESLLGDPVFRVVEVDPGGLGGETLTAARVLGEQLAQVPGLELAVVRLQGTPRGSIGEGEHVGHGASVSVTFFSGPSSGVPGPLTP